MALATPRIRGHHIDSHRHHNFQGRRAIRHRWTGKIACVKPIRNRWGAPPNGARPTPQPALGLAFAPGGAMQIAKVIKGDVPEIGVNNGVLEPIEPKPKRP